MFPHCRSLDQNDRPFEVEVCPPETEALGRHTDVGSTGNERLGAVWRIAKFSARPELKQGNYPSEQTKTGIGPVTSAPFLRTSLWVTRQADGQIASHIDSSLPHTQCESREPAAFAPLLATSHFLESVQKVSPAIFATRAATACALRAGLHRHSR